MLRSWHISLQQPPSSSYFHSTATVDALIHRHSSTLQCESNSHLFYAGASKSHPPHAGTPKAIPSFSSKQKSQAHQRASIFVSAASNNNNCQSFLLPFLSPSLSPFLSLLQNAGTSTPSATAACRRIQPFPCVLDYSSFHKRRCASSSKRPCGGDYAVVGTAFTKSFTSDGRTSGRTDVRTAAPVQSTTLRPVGQH